GRQALAVLHRRRRPRRGARLLPGRSRPGGAQRRRVRGDALGDRRRAVAARRGHRPRAARRGPERLARRQGGRGETAGEGPAARCHLQDRRLRRHLRARSRRGWRGAAGADRPAIRRPRLRLPRSLRQHAALQPASRAV
ncbi:MAG: Putative lyase PtlJ, partial [uncultured Rubrobacteraceae bacterium]